jgi:NADPH:quinone reductase-like Zn-dependent oxidoreductase
MKAVRLHRKNGPEALIYEEAPQPALGTGDVLVRVYACAITYTELSWSETYTNRDGTERLPTIPGHELSGVVEALAPGVTEAKVGDAVYALCDFQRDGAAADYTAVRAVDLAPKPPELSHVEAAAVPLAALTAWQGLFDHAGLTQGQTVLIHGATGGVGSFAVQLAHWRGARVIGTTSTLNLGLAHQLGADQVIDYTAVPFEDQVRNVDVVLDTVGGETRDRSWGVVRRGGVLVTIVGNARADQAAKYGVRGVDFIVKPSRAELIEIGRLIGEGKLVPIIEATFPLDQAREAFKRGGGGHNRGKIVLQVVEEGAPASVDAQVSKRIA